RHHGRLAQVAQHLHDAQGVGGSSPSPPTPQDPGQARMRWGLLAPLLAPQEGQWATRSLCPDWTVRDVLAHMTATAKMTPPRFFGKLLSSGFNFKKLQATDIAEE